MRKYIVAGVLSIFTVNGNQKTTQECTHKKRIVSEINDIKELTDGIFSINIKLINHYQRKDPCLKSVYDIVTYHNSYFRCVSNIYINLITCEDNIVITSIIQR